jgi:hypothetical protein
MRVSIQLCVVATLAVAAVAQDAFNQTYFDPSAMFGGAIGALQAQQMMSQKYGSLMLDYQSASGWMQVANGWSQMATIETNGAALEEDEEHVGSNYDEVEANTERALLYVLKMMYLQAGNKFSLSQQSHYQSKVLVAMLQSSGAAGNPAMSSALYMMYYLQILRLMNSATTIQRQDAWNTWLLHEIMETNEFANGHGDIPSSFLTTMAHSREVAMQLYYTEATQEFQIMYLEFYLRSMAGVPAANNAAASSFLEEEMTETPAEPNKPFMPFMMGGMGPQYLSYYNMYLSYFATIMNVQAAQGLYLHAHSEVSGEGVEHSEAIKASAVQALQQWSYLKLQQSMIAMYGLFSGAPVAHNTAAANSFVQTAAETSSPTA